MKPFPSRDRVLELLTYDWKTFSFYWVGKRRGVAAGKRAGCIHHTGYREITIDGKIVREHQLVWLVEKGSLPPDNLLIDHINGIKSDNSPSNLRLVTKSENAQNQRRAQSGNKSGYLGVVKRRSSFDAQIAINGKTVHLGCFDTPLEAHNAYLAEKRKAHPACAI